MKKPCKHYVCRFYFYL